jgi:hypothetical protein
VCITVRTGTSVKDCSLDGLGADHRLNAVRQANIQPIKGIALAVIPMAVICVVINPALVGLCRALSGQTDSSTCTQCGDLWQVAERGSHQGFGTVSCGKGITSRLRQSAT